jgi:glycerophosphoryl diester phosphodiesterase
LPSTTPVRERYKEAIRTGRPLLGGHRGNPAEYPENTLASFRSAIELGVDMIECDIHLSADNQLVVIHDDTVDRTTDGSGPVREMTVEQLRRLDAGRGERIPMLDEVFELVAGRCGLVIELKHGQLPYLGLEELLLGRLRQTGVIDDVTVISFHHEWVGELKQMEPGLVTGVLEVVPSGDPVQLLSRYQADVYLPHYSAATRELVDSVHASGRAVGVWVVDDEEAVQSVRASRPDFIGTNRPREIVPLFRRMNHNPAG